MAAIDVSFLLSDPDFTSTATLIQRAGTSNEFGEYVITETSSTIVCVVQPGTQGTFEKVLDSARLSDSIVVYYKGVISNERAGGYGDVIVWGGNRYQVKDVEDYSNYGFGFVKAVAVLEPVSV